MKGYLYFLRTKPEELYAFTMNKHFAKLFEYQRNMDLFYRKIIKDIDKLPDHRIFMNDNQRKIMIEEVLNNNGEDYLIIATSQESTELDESIEYMRTVFESVDGNFEEQFANVKKKYKRAVENLLNHSLDDDDFGEIQYNTFQLFFQLFNYTFFDTTETSDYVRMHM